MKRTFSIFILCLTAFVSAHGKPVSKPNPPAFEGVWQSCFRFSPSDKDNYARYGGEKICSGFVLVQQGKNLCGTWEYFASTPYEGRIQAIQQDATTARSAKICGRPGSYTQTACVNERSSSTTQPLAVTWETHTQTVFKLCKGRLFSNYIDNKQLPFDNCQTIRKYPGMGRGMVRKALTPSQKQILLQDPAIQQCLAGQE